jgi:hypothetical protein
MAGWRPEVRCLTCQPWSPREDWDDAPGQPFPFVIVCPRCVQEPDIAEVDYRLLDRRDG